MVFLLPLGATIQLPEPELPEGKTLDDIEDPQEILNYEEIEREYQKILDEFASKQEAIIERMEEEGRSYQQQQEVFEQRLAEARERQARAAEAEEEVTEVVSLQQWEDEAQRARMGAYLFVILSLIIFLVAFGLIAWRLKKNKT